MSGKLRVGLLFGGRSGEHEVSLRSAASILQALDQDRYEVVPIGITRQGRWVSGELAMNALAGKGSLELPQADLPASSVPGGLSLAAAAESASPDRDAGADMACLAPSSGGLLGGGGALGNVDLVFPVLHGTFGEDGTIQGLLEMAGLPYVGSGVLGSAAGMDKDVMKRLFGAAGLPQTPFLTITRREWQANAGAVISRLEAALRYPLFTKPANLGSSVGISKVHDRGELHAAMDLAASFDRKIVVEQGVGGPGMKPRELEVAVLGNDEPEASVVGEIVPAKEFYDYEAKYQLSGPDESLCLIPAPDLSEAAVHRIRTMALEAYRACECAGLARVDFLLAPGKDGGEQEIVLNEVNTMPGFTSISMYPKLWEASGVEYRALVDRLIALAQERHGEQQQTSFSIQKV